MKTVLWIIRLVVGLLFIFSGLVKANDPLGLSYKMQEFFEVWGWHGLNGLTLALSLVMNMFEVLAGVAVILGWRMKLFSWLLLLLIIFFSFLTGYALLSGKIKTCGCFGDCLPLTPAQSFTKDLILLGLILVLFFFHKRIKPILPAFGSAAILLLVMMGTAAGQGHVLQHLPLVDCLPYKKGNNLLEQMQTPPGAIPDSFSLQFIYEHKGKQLSFDQDHFPADFDSTYHYIDRKDVLVRKGNGLQANILDMAFQTAAGTDTTQALLHTPGYYLLVWARTMQNPQDWMPAIERLKKAAADKKIPVVIITADMESANKLFPGDILVTCDATVMKTAARVDPSCFLMHGAVVTGKKSFADMDDLIRQVQGIK